MLSRPITQEEALAAAVSRSRGRGNAVEFPRSPGAPCAGSGASRGVDPFAARATGRGLLVRVTPDREGAVRAMRHLPEPEGAAVREVCSRSDERGEPERSNAVCSGPAEEPGRRFDRDRRPAFRPAATRPTRLCPGGRGKRSSSFFAAMDLKESTTAVLAGEAMGPKPNAYGQIRRFRLPHSGLTVVYTTKCFRRAPGVTQGQMEPAIEVEPRPADWAAGRDPVLEFVLRQEASGARREAVGGSTARGGRRRPYRRGWCWWGASGTGRGG